MDKQKIGFLFRYREWAHAPYDYVLVYSSSESEARALAREKFVSSDNMKPLENALELVTYGHL